MLAYNENGVMQKYELNAVPYYKIEYAIMFLQVLLAGEDVPNETTVEAMMELENGGGESFDTLDGLWKSLKE